MLISSRELYQFYRDYLEWVEADEDNEIFLSSDGLCVNLYDYAYLNGWLVGALCEEMHKQFVDAGLNESVPFNEKFDHYTECALQICHKNEKRVQWVRDRVEDVKWLYEPIKAPLGKTC